VHVRVLRARRALSVSEIFVYSLFFENYAQSDRLFFFMVANRQANLSSAQSRRIVEKGK